MFAENRKISHRQLQALLLLDCFGTAVLFLPAELAQVSGRSCWLSALCGGGVFILAAFLLAKAGEKRRGTVVEWCRDRFGYLLGTGILLGLGGKMLLDGILELRLFSEIICRGMLPHTPVWVISAVILAVAGSLAAQGAECRGRTAEVLFLAVFLPLLIVLSAVALSTGYGRVSPVQPPDFSGIGAGILGMSSIFQGLTFLYFVFPEIRRRERISAPVVMSTTVTAGITTAVVFLCLAVYGEGMLEEKLLPALQMMERISFTRVFLTRQDVLLLWFWMASVCMFLSGTIFYGSLLGVRILRKKETERKKWTWICIILVFCASYLPRDLFAAYWLRVKIQPWLHLLYLIILPTVLLFKGGRWTDA